jgi:predicted amidohydrolase
MTIKGDLLIRAGLIVDPARNYFSTGDVLVRGNSIADLPAGETVQAEKEIDATGCMVFPGLIDFHAHVFHGGTEIGIHPDSALLPQGVTSAVDQGSAGVCNCDSFFHSVANSSQVRIFSHLHVSPVGLTSTRCPEPVDPKWFDLERTRGLFAKYPGRLLGLKLRQSKNVVGDLGLKPLAAAVQMADAIGCRVVVHTTDPPGEIQDLAAMLRPGDVFTHVYHGTGNTILDGQSKVKRGIQEARQRGVLFDTADGRIHYAFSTARAALADGFEPDLISTDVTRASLFERSVFGLPLIMSKYLTLGIPLQRVVKACTATPAALLGMQGKLGTLAPGAYADIAIFQLRDTSLKQRDSFGEMLNYSQVLVPQVTILNGKAAYRNVEF